MPLVKNKRGAEPPDKLAPYAFHGVDLATPRNGEAKGDCPFCGKEGKWSVSCETGQWHCWSCQEKGNIYTFLSKLWETSDSTSVGMDGLVEDRGFMGDSAPHQWGLHPSPLTGNWIIPGHNHEGKLVQLYAWMTDFQTGKRRLMPTTGLGHHLMGLPLVSNPPPTPDRPSTLVVCEGAWDGIALWEALRQWDQGETFDVVAIPGASSFPESWLPTFQGRDVVLAYHNDHPRTNKLTRAVIPPAGWEGMRRAAGVLNGVARSVRFLCWSNDPAKDHEPLFKDGWDVRDHLCQFPTAEERVTLAQELLSWVKDVPALWLSASSFSQKNGRGQKHIELEPVRCESWMEVKNQWKKCVTLTDDLDAVLSSMFAVRASVKQAGSQLWMHVLGPPSSCKTTLAYGLVVDRHGVVAESLSTIASLYSGYKSDKEGSEDFSFVCRIRDKVLVVPDGDTLLRSPNKDRILSQLRELYDRVGHSAYNNGMGGVYHMNMGAIFCGTSAMRELDGSELGERCLKVCVNEMTAEEEDDVGWMAVNRMAESCKISVNGRADASDSPDKVLAKRMMGGYSRFLGENAAELVCDVDFDLDARKMVHSLGAFTAFMRSRRSKKQDEDTQKEMPFRLQEQLSKLAIFTAVAMGKGSTDHDTMKRVRKAALDTSRGRVFRVCRAVAKVGREHGAFLATLSHQVEEPEEKLRDLLGFLRQVGGMETFVRASTTNTVNARRRWRLSGRMENLWREVMVEGGASS